MYIEERTSTVKNEAEVAFRNFESGCGDTSKDQRMRDPKSV